MQSKTLSTLLMGSMVAASLMFTGCGGDNNDNNDAAPAAPVITSNLGGTTAVISVTTGETAVTTVSATDADSTTLTYSISGGADQALFTINATTGVLAFTNAPTYGSDNTYEVIVTVTDGSLTDTQTITVNVTEDEAPVGTAFVGTTLSGAITSSVYLDATKAYKIDGLVLVKNGATLTIPAGTTLYGTTGSYMVIAKGSKIIAKGTADKPIIFTSETAYNGGTESRGQWGGLTLLGKATVNHADSFYEVDATNADFAFGPHGTETADDADSSGVLKYVQILNSSAPVGGQDKEVNGLSLAGVGSGTTVENILIKNSGDDGIEIWGGTVNLTDVAIINAGDDSLDLDYGYTGTVNGLFIKQEEEGNAGFEFSSGGSSPATNPTIMNFTMILSKDAGLEGGLYLKDDTTAGTYINGVIINDANDSVTKGAIYAKSAFASGITHAFKDVVLTGTNTVKFSGSGATQAETEYDTNSAVYPTPTYATTAAQVTLSGSYTADMALDATKVYKIDGLVLIKNGATLTIPAGTTLYGTTGSYMVVAKGAKIMAEGTADKPIIFTSEVAFNGGVEGRGQWGGLTILGKATVNHADSFYEVDATNADFAFGPHGSEVAADTDDSGVIRHVHILNSSAPVGGQDKEVNGLSLAGVGSGTTIENVTIRNSGDDGIEIWGGTVNLNGVRIINAGDDSLDTDYGYAGTVNTLFIKQEEEGNAGFEFSSGGSAPATDPRIENFGMILSVDAGLEGGLYLKDDTTAGTYVNGAIVNDANASITKGAIYAKSAFATGITHAFKDVVLTGTNTVKFSGTGATQVETEYNANSAQ